MEYVSDMWNLLNLLSHVDAFAINALCLIHSFRESVYVSNFHKICLAM